MSTLQSWVSCYISMLWTSMGVRFWTRTRMCLLILTHMKNSRKRVASSLFARAFTRIPWLITLHIGLLVCKNFFLVSISILLPCNISWDFGSTGRSKRVMYEMVIFLYINGILFLNALIIQGGSCYNHIYSGILRR